MSEFIAIDGLTASGKSSTISWLEENTNADTEPSHPEWAREHENEAKEHGYYTTLTWHNMANDEILSGKIEERGSEDPPLVKDRYILTREVVHRGIPGPECHPIEIFNGIKPDKNYILVADNETLRDRLEGDAHIDEYHEERINQHREAYEQVTEEYGSELNIEWINTSEYENVEETAMQIVNGIEGIKLDR